MKKGIILLSAVVMGAFLLASCEQPVGGDGGGSGSDIDLTGKLEVVQDVGDSWNAGADNVDYYRDGFYTEITYDPSWGAETGHPFFANVQPVDPDSSLAADHPQFLRAAKGYGNSQFVWRVYGASAGFDNGFDDNDEVTFAIDVWVPDMSTIGALAWFEIHAVGGPVGTAGSYTDTDQPTVDVGDDADGDGRSDYLVVKYENEPDDEDPGIDGTGTGGGWVTFQDTVTIDPDHGLFDVRVTMGNTQANGTYYLAYFDNFRVVDVVPID